MKLIVAYIQPEKLNSVKKELYAREVFKMSVTNALGCGQQGGYHGFSWLWLSSERELVGRAIDSGKKFLGICLGAQVIALTLGAEVVKAPQGNWLAPCPVDRCGQKGWYSQAPAMGVPGVSLAQ